MTCSSNVGHQAHLAAPPDVSHLLKRGEAAARAGKKAEARYFFETALKVAPDHPQALLWLAYLAGGGRASMPYLARLLKVEPTNQRAQAAVLWAQARLEPGVATTVPALPRTPGRPGAPVKKRGRRRWGALVGSLVLILVSGLVSVAFAKGALNLPLPTPTRVRLIAVASPTSLPTYTPTHTPTPAPSATPTEQPTLSTTPPTPTTRPRALIGTRSAGGRPPATMTPTPTLAPTVPPPTAIPTALPTTAIGDSFRWIDVDLTHQRLIAYEGETPVRTVIVSTGLPRTPTVTGRFQIYVKYKAAHMSGVGYNLPNVPYVMYFYRGYALHGTYWHTNFGQPMSHGCVNLPTPDAEWLYNWTSVGTLVFVHY
jgi:lipoprotein-anchoring transpeptidase ErfK/SrfK